MDLIITSVVGIILFFYTWLCKPKLLEMYPKIKMPADLMVMAIIILGVISAVESGIFPAASFFISLPILLGIFVWYGIKHRHEVSHELRRTYFAELVGYSYIFVASAVLMSWALPLMNNIIL